jgi:hypothetical protein
MSPLDDKTSELPILPVMPTVSAVIPTMLGKDRLPFIRSAIDSVLNQDFTDFEVIVVHNGSDSALREGIADYLDRIRYCYSAIGNIGEARNTGAKEARGQFVALLDDDDLWVPHKLRVQVAAMQSNPDVDVLFTDMELFDQGRIVHPSYLRHVGGVESLASHQRAPGIHVQAASWFEYLISNYPFLPSTWMAKRDVLLEMRFPPTPSEDRELLWRLARTKTLGFIDQVLTRKRDHESNFSLNLVEECTAGIVDIARNARKWPLTPRERSLVRHWEADAHFQLGYLQRKRGEHSRALRHQVSSLMLAPRVVTLKEAAKSLLRMKGHSTSQTLPSRHGFSRPP